MPFSHTDSLKQIDSLNQSRRMLPVVVDLNPWPDTRISDGAHTSKGF